MSERLLLLPLFLACALQAFSAKYQNLRQRLVVPTACRAGWRGAGLHTEPPEPATSVPACGHGEPSGRALVPASAVLRDRKGEL